MRRVVLIVLAALAVAAPASASRRSVPVLLGIKGDVARFQSQTGQDSMIRHVIVAWGQGQVWGSHFPQLFQQMGGIPMLGLSMGNGHGGEAIDAQQIAQGKGDSYLVALNAGIASFGQEVYIRPFGEMNGYWNVYCAYTQAGRIKPGHQTTWFKKAFARVYLIVHGGTNVDARLVKLGMPPLAGGAAAALAENGTDTTHVVWNPQGYGAPNLPGNSAQAYYPGDRYVDVVGDDIYDIRGKAEWPAADALYRAHPSKPFSFPEWGLWDLDDPAFVQTMATFIKTHPRTGVVAYFEATPGSIYDLATKPKSRAAYKKLITPLGG
jgi:hypothetical protein